MSYNNDSELAARRFGLASPAFYYATSSHSGGSSHSPTLPPNYSPPLAAEAPNFYMSSRDFRRPSMLWPPPNPDLTPQHYPPSSRRYSVASVSPPPSAGPYIHKSRRISLPKYQNMPASNYLQVPSINHFDIPATNNVYIHPNELAPDPFSPPKRLSKSNRKSSESKNSRSNRRASDSVPSMNRAKASVSEDQDSISEEGPVPPAEFQFNSSDLPLRPPSVEELKKYSVASGSDSTPENQRNDLQQMIKKDVEGGKIVSKTLSLGDMKIFSSRAPTLCTHDTNNLCKSCNNKIEVGSVAPTLTIRDPYPARRPPLKRSPLRCSCGSVCAVTVILAVFVMVFISGFIIYIETVLKYQTANALDRM